MKTAPLRAYRKRTLAAVLVTSLLLGAMVTPGTARADTSTATGGGGDNLVQVINQVSNSLRVGGNVQLNRIPGPTVAPVNDATALNVTCDGCQTISVALQINLYGNNVAYFAPQNRAVAVNSGANNALAKADAFQCGIQVADPTQVPPEVTQFINAMRTTLKTIPSDPSMTAEEAQTEIQGVVDQYNTLLSQDLGAPDSCQATYDVVTP